MIKTKSLVPHSEKIICQQSTEVPFTGKWHDSQETGTYLCRQCGVALFRSSMKFHSASGWPSFDQEIPETVKRIPDKDRARTEIVCARCQGHLGHVFTGEHYTDLNTRHCVNSASLDFVPFSDLTDSEEAIFAGGCFWGIDYFFKRFPGVLKVEVGYTGGKVNNPSYSQVCEGNTHHLEAVRILYDPRKCNFEQVARHFFEIHDPTQKNGQGSDVGPQYESAIFYYDDHQKKIAHSLIELLTQEGYDIATQLFPVSTFWPAEEYHQDYYEKTKKTPYCHRYVKRFK